MTDLKNLESLIRIIADLQIFLGSKEDPERLLMYAKELEPDYTVDQIEEALKRLRRRCEFFPRMCEILAELDGKPDPKLEGMFQWTRLRKHSGSRRYNPEALADPKLAWIFRAMGGPQDFGKWNFEQEHFYIKQFCDWWAVLQSKEQRGEDLEPLLEDSRLESEGILKRIGAGMPQAPIPALLGLPTDPPPVGKISKWYQDFLKKKEGTDAPENPT